MEKYVDIQSPFTGGRVKEVTATELKEFRKEKYLVHVRYYVCEDTGEQFTTTAQDTLQFNDLYAQYRSKHGIPFPEEIKNIRTGYGLNLSQISKILGFGVNQYAKYESGEVPSESNGKMIAAIRDKNVLLGMLSSSKASFTPSEYERIYSVIVLNGKITFEKNPLFQIIYKDSSRSILNGYGSKSIPKLFEMVAYIVAKHGEVFPTKLNKLMFYSDFFNYRETGVSISGLQYKALPYGPAPDHYATIYDNTPGIEKRIVETHDMSGSLLSTLPNRDFELLSESEKVSIDKVVELLRPLSVSQISEASHQEEAWADNSTSRSYIPYDYAFDLKVI